MFWICFTCKILFLSFHANMLYMWPRQCLKPLLSHPLGRVRKILQTLNCKWFKPWTLLRVWTLNPKPYLGFEPKLYAHGVKGASVVNPCLKRNKIMKNQSKTKEKIYIFSRLRSSERIQKNPEEFQKSSQKSATKFSLFIKNQYFENKCWQKLTICVKCELFCKNKVQKKEKSS